MPQQHTCTGLRAEGPPQQQKMVYVQDCPAIHAVVSSAGRGGKREKLELILQPAIWRMKEGGSVCIKPSLGPQFPPTHPPKQAMMAPTTVDGTIPTTSGHISWGPLTSSHSKPNRYILISTRPWINLHRSHLWNTSFYWFTIHAAAGRKSPQYLWHECTTSTSVGSIFRCWLTWVD